MNINNSTPKKRILLMGHVDGLGGAQTAYRELFDFVNKAGYDVKIINITDDNKPPFGTDVLVGSVEHKVTGALPKAKKYNSLLKAGIRAKFFRPDIFVSVGLSNSSNFITRFLANDCFKIAQDFIANRLVDDEIWCVSRNNFNGIALQAPSMLNYWQSTLSNISGVNWLPCFPEPPVKGVLRVKKQLQQKQIKLAYFGRLAGNKGLPLLFKALSSLPDSNSLVLDLWGKGEEEANLRKVVNELDLEAKVNFLGGYPAKKAGAELMASYDGLVLTSTEMEGLPLILLESMAYGLPFMATNIGAIRDCCIDNPDTILVQPTQDDITIGLSVLIARIRSNDFDPSRLRLFYEQKFSHEVMASRWKECFDDPKQFFYESR
ncbi:glycosyltransferase [Mucilaginibacter sp. SP1R1]|uniref:glycosyltransferase n=1 Tax=Mucilaginibacter sp. SP1R1 TaxID=2723091 RepID=UPI0016082331|nr:glycosyltransferase [Mucilaginibacter sp. SP1R1]MBB6149069.1 glycosyltransferase involved in cell wall biosynthesis [Mucilaginibacter sp. SP1R1]